MPVEEQVVSIFAGTKGYLDGIPVEDVKRFEADLLDYARARHADVLANIKATGQLPEGDELDDIINAFKDEFTPSESADDLAAARVEDGDLVTDEVGGRGAQHLPEQETAVEEGQ